MMVLWKAGFVAILKTWIGQFSKYFENRGLFSKYFEKYPLLRGHAIRFTGTAITMGCLWVVRAVARGCMWIRFFGKPDLWRFWKHGLANFQNILKIGVCFQNILKKYPWRRLRLRPPGAAAPGGGGICSKYVEHRPLVSKYFENRPIHVFKIATNPAFQRTII